MRHTDPTTAAQPAVIDPAFIAPAFIAGDWGTSHLRLSLCAADGRVLAGARGPGAGAVAQADFPRVLADLIAPWEAPTALPVLLCGMVGSALGWREVPYLACEESGLGVADVAAALAPVVDAGLPGGRRVFIVPGVRGRNAQGGPDVMRGEETQILGALALEPSLAAGDWRLCLPGTHAKWVDLAHGRLQGFTTAPTGEVYALLSQHSTMARGAGPWAGGLDDPAAAAAFAQGVALSAVPGASLLHHLFEARSRRMVAALGADVGLPFLSGLLIGADVAAMTTTDDAAAPLVLIGGDGLTALYAAALRHLGRAAPRVLDGERLSVLGLAACYRQGVPSGLFTAP